MKKISGGNNPIYIGDGTMGMLYYLYYYCGCKLENWFDTVIENLKIINCFNYPYVYDKTKEPYRIPVLQYIIFFLWTLFTFREDLIGGEFNMFIFKMVIMLYMTIFLLIRFSIITKKHEKIEECDVWIVQTVAFVVLTEYIFAGMKIILRPLFRTHVE